MRPSNDSGYLNLARLSVSLLRRQSRERGAESMCAPGGARARDEPMSSPSGSPSEGEVRRKSEDEYQSAALRGPTAVVARPGIVQPRWLAETSSWGDRLRLAACLRGRVVLPQSLALQLRGSVCKCIYSVRIVMHNSYSRCNGIYASMIHTYIESVIVFMHRRPPVTTL